MCKKQFIGIIPARYASTRFPGKPLALIGGKPMIQRVYEQATKALETVVVATDDQRIADCVRAFGGQAVMTRTDHKCGTDRCLEALQRFTGSRKSKVESQKLAGEDACVPENDTNSVGTLSAKRSVLCQQSGLIVINIQGDEPFIQPGQIEALKHCFDDDSTQIATLVKPFTEHDSLADLENPNTPKVAVAPDGTALFFSRSVIPYLRGVDKNDWLKQGTFFRHIGMYAYTAEVLEQITQLPQTPLEKAESLEQLRWLENGYRIRVAVTPVASMGIDTPEDLKKAEAFLIDNL